MIQSYLSNPSFKKQQLQPWRRERMASPSFMASYLSSNGFRKNYNVFEAMIPPTRSRSAHILLVSNRKIPRNPSAFSLATARWPCFCERKQWWAPFLTQPNSQCCELMHLQIPIVIPAILRKCTNVYLN